MSPPVLSLNGTSNVSGSTIDAAESPDPMQHQGLQILFEEHREQLLRYLRAHGAGDAAEDLLQELWLKVAAVPTGPVASPKSYLYRAATNLMIDRRRSEAQAQRREREWSGLADRLPDSAANDPGPDRQIDGRRMLALVELELSKLPSRAVAVFRAHRIAGRTQREIAADFGLSASTIESDLRTVYRALADIRGIIDGE